MKTCIALLWVLLVSAMGVVAEPAFILSCSPDNDLFRLLKQNGAKCERADSPEAAITKASDGGAVLILAEGYPTNRTVIPESALAMAREKGLKMYVEFAESITGEAPLPNETLGVTWERGIVSSEIFGSSLPPLTILALHDCRFVPLKAENPWIVIGRVAGFDKAVFGLPTNAYSILFEVPEHRMIVATTKLSDFVTARYAPADHWTVIWEKILSHLSDGKTIRLNWSPIVAPRYNAAEKLPRDFEKRAFHDAADWLHNSRLLVPPSRTNEIHLALAKNGEVIPLPDASTPS
ncbi:MAG: hypothetical protein ACK4UN_08280, partial [Limisphaerales bacterium]